MKKFLSFILMIALAFTFVACKKTPTDVAVTSVTVSADKLELEIGETAKATATIAPADATSKTVTWTTSDSAIATVSNSGTITAVASGKATISATANSDKTKSGSIEITVKEPAPGVAPTSIVLSGKDFTLNANMSMTLTATVTPADAEQRIVWSSSDETIATVKDGVVTGVKPGDVTIYAASYADANVKGKYELIITEALIAPTSITLKGANDATQVPLNGTLALTIEALPEGASDSVTWSSSDDAIATVYNGTVSGVALGSVTIYAYSKVDETIFGSIDLTVEEMYVEPEAIEISCKNQVAVGSSITLEYKALPEGASTTDTATWTIDNEDYAKLSVTSKGKERLSGLEANQQVTVTCSVTTQSGKTLVADVVIVIVEVISATTADPESIIIMGSSRIVAGVTNKFNATIYPANALQGKKWTSSDESVAKVATDGKVTGVGEGTCYIIATAAVNSEISASYKVTVVAQPSIEPVTDMQGFEVNVFEASSNLQAHDPRLEGYTSSDKAAKIAAWEATESKFNCKLGVKAYPASAPWGNSRIKWINTQTQNNKIPTNDEGDTASIYVMPSYWIAQLVAGNSLVDTTEFYEAYGFSQMSSYLVTETTYQGKIYGVAQELGVAEVYLTDGLVYNYGLLKELGLESPAKLFNEGKWSYSDFKEYCLQANVALKAKSEEYTVLCGRPALYYLGMVNASGMALCDVNTISTNFSSDIARSSLQTLSDIYKEIGWGTCAWDNSNDSFNKGNTLFQSAYWWFINNSGRFTEDLWGAGNTEYGYVPYPWADSLTKADTTCVHTPGSTYCIAAREYPSGISAEDIYKVWYYANQQTDLNITNDINYSADEALYTLCENKVSDPESITAVQYFTNEKVIFDPTYTLGTSYHTSYLAPDTQAVVFDGTDYDEALSHIALYQKALEESYGSSSN